MRMQVMVHGGPFDGHLFTQDSIGNETPVELRLAQLAEEFDLDEDRVSAHLYRLVDEELQEGARTKFVSYSYLRPKESRIGLVDHWIA